MGDPVEQARLAFDLAKIDLVVAEARASLDDDRLTFRDVAAIRGAARNFGVTERMAYLRARGLGLLSYQGAALTAQSGREGRDG